MKKRKIVYFFVLILLTSTTVTVSSGINDLEDTPPLPGDMSYPYPNFQLADYSVAKSYSPKILSEFTNEGVIELIQKMNETLILGYLENLTAFGPRVTGTTACYDAGEYIYDEFEGMGLDVRFHNWSYSGYTDRNVEATLHGTNESSDEIYIICAHFDSVPGSPGADDDGTGTVAAIASAFIMKDLSFNHTIRFVTFSGEEQGLLGSHEYAAEASANEDNIVAVLNVDMIGFSLSAEDGNYVKIYYNTASEWLTDFTDYISVKYFDYIGLNIVPSGYSYGSDHYSFWQNSYDAIFYHEYNFNDYYHSPQDTIENMNITYSAKCSKLIIATLAELASPCIIGDPPVTPVISGPTSGIADEEIEFTIATTDPDNDDVYYFVNWGDGTNSEWLGPYASGEEVKISHSWSLSDSYDITARAKDSNSLISDWSNPFNIEILGGPAPEIKSITGGLFKIKSMIKNTGGLDATDVNWKIELQGGVLIGKTTSGIVNIEAGQELEINSQFILGFGPTKITVTTELDDKPFDSRTQGGLVILFYLLVNPGGSV